MRTTDTRDPTTDNASYVVSAVLLVRASQHQQTRSQRGAVHDLLLTTAGPGRVGDADTHHHLGLADIDRGDPLDDLFAVLDALHAMTPSRPRGPRCEPEERPVRADMIKAKLIHVLEAH